ncbi:PhnB protein [Haloactinopolyspora alba]|uniref:PhnB protein n=1 Tax=Haloactinopolyspora alba TaxID=648780 RepID=A0A2P8DRE1_9ACTN|nr:VOC family protein [Haloactinopolyspora alba]PSK99780.1 PhnB protein [Haloactinopolyspora alba]
MTNTVAPVPAGFHSLNPYIAVDGAAEAIDFYRRAFGAKQISRMDGPDGTVMHAELRIGDSTLQMGDPLPEYGLIAPGADGVTSAIMIYCEDVDALFAQAVEAGASVVTAVNDFPSGDRYGTVMDPFGHRWSLATRVEDVSPEEAERRIAEWIAQQS